MTNVYHLDAQITWCWCYVTKVNIVDRAWATCGQNAGVICALTLGPTFVGPKNHGTEVNPAYGFYKLLVKNSATDCAELMQPSKFVCVNASPHAISKGEEHNTVQPGAPSTPRTTWLYRHLIQRLSSGAGRSGMICLTCDMRRSLIVSWSVSQCWVLKDFVACIRREGPISVGSEKVETNWSKMSSKAKKDRLPVLRAVLRPWYRNLIKEHLRWI